jgi:4-amino-4-deoxy-L-arabinose transferase-like glycosyltransferase
VRRSLVPIVLLAAMTFFAGLGRGAITDSDEAFYAEAAREMVESGDWLTPYFNYEPRFQKPVLYYWLTAGTYLVTGPTETGARLWAALSGLGLVLVTAAAGRRWYDEDTGLLAGAIAATSFGYFAMARSSLPDLPLAFCITWTIWAALVALFEREASPARWLLLAALGAALGFLTKGPLALLLPALVVVPIVVLERRAMAVGLREIAAAALLFAVVALPWYVAMYWQHGTAYLESFFVGDNFERFATDRFNEPRPWWFYLPVVLGGLLPWTPLLVLLWAGRIKDWLLRRISLDVAGTRLVIWAVLPLLFFTASIGKQPRYVLPVLPPLAILLAGSVVDRTRAWRSLDGGLYKRRAGGAVTAGVALAGLLLVALAFLLYRALPLFVGVPPAATWMAIGVLGAGGVVVLLTATAGGWRVAPWVLAIVAAVGFPALQWGTSPPADDEAVRRMAGLIAAQRRAGEEIGTYGAFVRNLVFYTGVRHTDLVNDDQLTAFLAHTERVLIVVPAPVVERLEAAAPRRVVRLGEVRYLDQGALRLRTIIWPDPDREIRRVLLVSNR